jgi:hypothetical protein
LITVIASANPTKSDPRTRKVTFGSRYSRALFFFRTITQVLGEQFRAGNAKPLESKLLA